MQIYLLLTEKCDLACSMCRRGEKRGGELSLLDLRKLAWVNELENHDIVITGGEPTLCHDFESIICYISKIARTVSICTNGINNSYLTKKFFLPNIRIQISLDGTEKYHDSIRGVDTYKKVFLTIEKLEELEVPYTIATVVSRKNKECMIELSSRLAKLKKMQYWSISYEMPFGSATSQNMMPSEEWNLFVDTMLEFVDFKMKIKKIFPLKLYDEYREKLESLFANNICSNCGSGREKIYIYPNLEVYPCTCLTDFSLGNWGRTSLKEILGGKKTKLFAEYKVAVDSVCFTCKYLKCCNGGCIGMSYNYFKELGRGDKRCPKIMNN